jgi:hypothetical protein
MGINRLLITALIVLHSISCLMAEGDHDASVNRFVDVLKEIGKRKHFDLTQDALKREIIDLGSKIALLDRSHARLIIANYLTYLKDLKVDEQMNGYMLIYIVNRIYFAVPEWIPKSEFRPFGGFVGWHRYDDEKVNIRFPLNISPDGRMTIEAGNTSYMGPPYQGLAEFDFFSSKYPSRTGQKQKER